MNDAAGVRARRPGRRGRPAGGRRRPACRSRRWRLPTPAEGWDVATQVAHLAWTDEAATAAATDKQAWDALVLEALADPEHAVDKRRSGRRRAAAAPQLLDRWRAGRVRLADGAARVPRRDRRCRGTARRCRPTSMATARFMETWAHSLDVYAALGVEPEVSDRIRHVAHLGVRTRRFSFAVARRGSRRTRSRASTLTAPSGDALDVGPRGCRRVGDRSGVRLLPAGHPARAPRRHRAGRDRSRRRPVARHRAVLRGSAGRGAAGSWLTRSGSATAPASTATGSRRCARCSRTGRSTSSPATTSPS